MYIVHILKKRFKIYHIYVIKNPRSNHWQYYVFFWNNFGTLWHGQTCAAQLIYIYILFLDDRLMEVHSWPEPSFDCLYRKKKKIFKTHIFNKHMLSVIISGCYYACSFWAKRLVKYYENLSDFFYYSDFLSQYLKNIMLITYHSRALRNAEFLKVQACEQNSEVSQNTSTYFGFKTTSTIVLHIYLPILLNNSIVHFCSYRYHLVVLIQLSSYQLVVQPFWRALLLLLLLVALPYLQGQTQLQPHQHLPAQ